MIIIVLKFENRLYSKINQIIWNIYKNYHWNYAEYILNAMIISLTKNMIGFIVI